MQSSYVLLSMTTDIMPCITFYGDRSRYRMELVDLK